MPENQMPKVIYIAGYGRSESTLLDCIFARKPRIFGSGELTNIFDDRFHDRPCSCGESLKSCEVWSRVLPDATSDRNDLELAKATRRAVRLFMQIVL